MMRYLAFLLGVFISWTAVAQQVPHPAPMSLPNNNVALKALTGSTNLRAARLGFVTPGDGGYAEYNWSLSNCAAADDGAQVQPTATGCWIADFSGKQPTPKIWGAKGDGTDDTLMVQAAISARVNQALWLGPWKYTVGPLTSAGTVQIVGSVSNAGIYHQQCDYGLVARAANLTLLTLSGNNNRITDVCIQMGATEGLNTFGAGIAVGVSAGTVIENSQVNFPCIGFDISGSGTNQNVNTVLRGVTVAGPHGSGCGGIRVGANSINSSTVDLILDHTTTVCYGGTSAGAFGMLVRDAGGLVSIGNERFGCGYGTQILPGANQWVMWTRAAAGDVLGDTSDISNFVIDTAAATAIVGGNYYVGTWTSAGPGVNASGATGDNTVVRNTAGGLVWGIHFVGHRIYQSAMNGLRIGPGVVRNITYDNGSICASSMKTFGTYSHVLVEGGNQSLALRGNTIGENCDSLSNGVGNTALAGITFAGGVTGVIITDNDLLNLVSAFSGDANLVGGSVVFRGNLGISNLTQTVASTATIAPGLSETQNLTGTTAITTINGAKWQKRQITFTKTDSGTLALNTGGNICNAVSLNQYGVALATWHDELSCWVLK